MSDPKKEDFQGTVITLPHNWTPRSYQENVWRYFQDKKTGGRAVCMWHRRAGKDLVAINLIACKAAERVGAYWHVFPTYKQGKNVAWHGSTKDGRRFLDHFPREMIANTNATDLRVEFVNGSTYQVVGSDNIDSLVGTNPIGVVMSEYSLQDPRAWNYLRPILSENDGWALFIYTARGRNHGFDLFNMASVNGGWFCEKLVAGSGPEGTKKHDGTPVITDEAIDEERKAGMPEEMIQQEYYNSFDAPMVGAYYSQGMDEALKEGRIGTHIGHDARLPVDTYWDLGFGDATAIWFVQSVGNEHRIIDYYEDSGEGLPSYVSALMGRKERTRHMSHYNYRHHYAPHDIQVHEFTSGRSRLDTARSLGVRFRVAQKHSLEDGIDAVRNILPRCFFNSAKAIRGIDGLRAYRKEWDSRNSCFKDSPVHDWTSHPADAFRIFAWCHKQNFSTLKKQNSFAIDNFDYTRGVNSGFPG